MDLSYLRNEIIGHGSFMNGPYGKRLITYADYTASGKHLRFLENYYLKLRETYGNTHTEDSYTGRHTTRLYNDAKKIIISCVKANNNYSIFPSGTGATGAIDKLTKILGIYKTPEYFRLREEYLKKLDKNSKEVHVINNFEENFNEKRPVVFISSYEHHSNELQWREGFSEVVKIDINKDGLFDIESLEKHLCNPKYRNRLKIGSFSATSNVTGIKTPVYEVAKIMHKYGGYVFFDFATSGPYLEINMTKDKESYFDGIYLSMHKFLGGPESCGILVLNKALYNGDNIPCSTGGGTVQYVTDDDHEYLADYDERENAGTPGIMQLIRAAMALELKDIIGINNIQKIETYYISKAFEELSKVKNLEILGNQNSDNRIGIISFNIKYKEGYLHHGFVTTLLNDLFGIQSRAGCSCAGPYGIKLLGIDNKKVEKFKEVIRAEIGSMKPGWTRINFHYTLDEDTFNYIIKAIKFIANYGHEFLEQYKVGCIDARWTNKNSSLESSRLNILDALLLKRGSLKTKNRKYKKLYRLYFNEAHKIRDSLNYDENNHVLYGKSYLPDIAWFYYVQ